MKYERNASHSIASHTMGCVALLAASTHGQHADELHGWELDPTPFESALLDNMDAAIESEAYRSIHAVVVVRDGKLLVERYYNGSARDSLHNPRSVGKTFASAVAGLALRDGHIESLEQTLAEFYDLGDYENASPKKSAVTLRHLLTMTSGFEGFDFDPESIGNELNMYPQDNWVDWTLNLPMAEGREPGEAWFYFTAGVVLLGDILNRSVPGALEEYTRRELFEPLGISAYRWQYTPQQVPSMAGGLELAALDFAKFGQLYKNGGVWKGQAILPPEWVAASLFDHSTTTIEDFRYGYLWWKRTYRVGGHDLRTSFCTGNGGNRIYVFEDEPLVVVITASAYNQPYMHSQVEEMMTRYILPALIQ